MPVERAQSRRGQFYGRPTFGALSVRAGQAAVGRAPRLHTARTAVEAKGTALFLCAGRSAAQVFLALVCLPARIALRAPGACFACRSPARCAHSPALALRVCLGDRIVSTARSAAGLRFPDMHSTVRTRLGLFLLGRRDRVAWVGPRSSSNGRLALGAGTCGVRVLTSSGHCGACTYACMPYRPRTCRYITGTPRQSLV